jgi:hypothetical protein
MTSIVELIKKKDAGAIVDHCQRLTIEQRHEMIDYLKRAELQPVLFGGEPPRWDDPKREEYYSNYAKVQSCFFFAFVACTRTWTDYKKTEYREDNGWEVNPLKQLMFDPVHVPLVSFFISFPPDYLDKVVQELKSDTVNVIDFRLLWRCYEHGWISFDELYFTRSLFTIRMFKRDTRRDAELLLANPRILHEVFLRFYRNEIPVLDISKWQARKGFVCKKVYEYWTEVIVLLQESGYVFERSLVADLLESLLNNWKKGHLDWHIRLLDLFKPTKEELIQHQSLLFSLLGTQNPTVINFSIRQIKDIYTSADFDGRSFIENFALCFSNEKCTKAILTGLGIFEVIRLLPDYRDIDFSEQLAILFIHPDVKLQQQVAKLLLRFSDEERIGQVTEPYIANIKQAIKQQLLLSSTQKFEPEASPIQKKMPHGLKVPSTWDELLFQIGQCIRTKSAVEIDLFLEGVNQLQRQIPADVEKQLKPYTKQLFSRPWESHVMAYFTRFLQGWITQTPIVIENEKRSPIPFLKNKCNWLLEKLNRRDELPFLSTPTHAPFFIHPTALIERVLRYEKQGVAIYYEDLIVACNRTWVGQCDEVTRRLAEQLKGSYGDVLRYYTGVSDRVVVRNDQLELWAQVTRIKNPEAVFPELEKTHAGNFPGVVHPLHRDFKIRADASGYGTWHRLFLEGNWNRTLYDEYYLLKEYEAEDYSHLYYNISAVSTAVRVDIPYQLSLNPGYADGQLCRYVPRVSTGNEVPEQEHCLYPMRFLLDHEIAIHHCGWIYVAACLVFEKKISRDLAGEYITVMLTKKGKELGYLADVVGKLISQKYAPVNRLLEFFDRPEAEYNVNLFQLQVLERCIMHFDGNALPSNSKKIIEYYYEWSQRLGMPERDIIQDKIKSIKKK